MQSFVIEGGRPLGGTIRAAGNKNGALPILAACALATEPVQLTKVELTAENDIRVDPTGIHKTELDEELCRRIRASFLLAGPLLARFGRVTVPPPGGRS